MALEQELTTCRAHLTELAASHDGEFVLIRGDQILGTFAGYEEALREGYYRCGLTRFMVKEIRIPEPVASFSRSIALCEVPRDQWWFYTPEIQARIAEAEAGFREGRFTQTNTLEEAQAFLDRLKAGRTYAEG